MPVWESVRKSCAGCRLQPAAEASAARGSTCEGRNGMTVQQTDSLHKRMNRLSAVVGTLLVDGFHYLALFAIGGAIVWSAVHAFIGMASKGLASIDDILLLFIYLELGAMVGIY